MPKYKFISPKEMDGITEKILTDTGVSLSFTGKVTPIDIDTIIEFDFGLTFQWENIDYLDPNAVVLAAIHPRSKTIFMNESKRQLFSEKIGTLNFSKAHELGHWVLHITDFGKYEQGSFQSEYNYFCRSYSKRPPAEIQADMFAASLLMPAPIIHEAIHSIKRFRKVTYHDLYKLAEQLEVSITALVHRTRDLNLLYFTGNKVFNSADEALGQETLF